MSIDTSAVLVVGLPLSGFPDDFDYDEFDGILDRVPSYYDAPNEHCIFGVVVAGTGDYDSTEIPGGIEALSVNIESAYEEFQDITGLDGKLYLSPYIT